MIILFVAVAAGVMPCAGGQGHALRPTRPPPSPPPQAYLLRVGPPNLRFESSHARAVATPTRYALTESSPSELAVATAPPIAIPTNVVPITTVVTKADSTPTPTPATTPTLNLTPSGADPSIVTSAMLADYLTPTAPGKNNSSRPAVVVPVNLGFTPPTPAADNPSHAVYKSE